MLSNGEAQHWRNTKSWLILVRQNLRAAILSPGPETPIKFDARNADRAIEKLIEHCDDLLVHAPPQDE